MKENGLWLGEIESFTIGATAKRYNGKTAKRQNGKAAKPKNEKPKIG